MISVFDMQNYEGLKKIEIKINKVENINGMSRNYNFMFHVSFIIYTSVACAVGPSVTNFSTDFSFQNLVFWNLFEFSAAEIT
jgi:hypothetical protein